VDGFNGLQGWYQPFHVRHDVSPKSWQKLDSLSHNQGNNQLQIKMRRKVKFRRSSDTRQNKAEQRAYLFPHQRAHRHKTSGAFMAEGIRALRADGEFFSITTMASSLRFRVPKGRRKSTVEVFQN
jgi:hypothetical protein